MQTDDPRIGSARGTNTSTAVTHIGQGSNSSSLTGLASTLIPTSIYAATCLVIFWVARRKCPGVYSPRSILSSLLPHERSPVLPAGWLNWIRPFYQIPDAFVLNHSSIDGYLFLRLLKILIVIYFVGCCIVVPILVPIHAFGGAGLTELDRLSFGNVVDETWYYGHAAAAWLYLGFVLFMIWRECTFYINLRQAYLLSPFFADRLSSRTVLFSCVPRDYLDETRLRQLFGNTIKTTWLPQQDTILDNLVQERRQTALRLERAEVRLVRMANVARHQALQKGNDSTNGGHKANDAEPQKEAGHTAASTEPDGKQTESATGIPLSDVSGSVAAQWIPHRARPTHRPLANKFRRIDTIKWTRLRIKVLTKMINKLRRQQVRSSEKRMPVAFIEFKTLADAQAAHQSLTHHEPLFMSPRYIGVRPFEIVWQSLSMGWWERFIRRFAIQAAVAALILFWSIPCALVGTISHIDYLAEKVPFLHWIEDVPQPVLGLMTSLLPAVALALLMSLVPFIMRVFARVAGVPTLSMIELFCQDSYFAFQVIQVFLITTLTSAASAAATKILSDPSLAQSLLSKNLPKASNFYISYFLVQNLALAAGDIVHLGRLFRLHVLSKLKNNPRQIWNRWHGLQRIHWGAIFPVYTNLGVIGLSYSLIAPIILCFATLGTIFVYGIFRYNLIFFYDSEISTMGLVYPRALLQLLMGAYFAEICMIGLFSLKAAWGPLALMVALLVFTILVHISLNETLAPLLSNLPRTLLVEKQPQPQHKMASETQHEQFGDGDTGKEHMVGDVIQEDDEFNDEQEGDIAFEPEDPGSTRTMEGLPNAGMAAWDLLKTVMASKIGPKADPNGPNDPNTTSHGSSINSIPFPLSRLYNLLSPRPVANPTFIQNFIYPTLYTSPDRLRATILSDLYHIPSQFPSPPVYSSPHIAKHAYSHPSLSAQTPILWIPRDPAGVSEQEVQHTNRILGAEITDSGASLREDGGIELDVMAAAHMREGEWSGLRW